MRLYQVIVYSTFFFFNDTATTEIYTYFHTLSLHDALPISISIQSSSTATTSTRAWALKPCVICCAALICRPKPCGRSEEHTSELQSLMRTSYAVFCLKKKNTQHTPTHYLQRNLDLDHIANPLPATTTPYRLLPNTTQ